ncbi:10807_t:CDS:2, partial [Diversispora eburnea]
NPKDGSRSELFALNNSSLLFSIDDPDIQELTVSKSLSWEHIINEPDKHANQLKKKNNCLKNCVRLYWYSIPFSIDLISAVFRQRKFTKKMVNNEIINHTEVQANATIRYLKFLFLMKEKQNTILVPTLDIDLCWHTHQIHASLYREFTKKHIGQIINHDDTLAEGVLSDGFATTARAWFKNYREPYTHDDPSKIWLTTKKKIMSVIIPPYGLLVHNRLKKYKKTLTKQHEKDIKIYNFDEKNVESVESEKGKEKGDISSKYDSLKHKSLKYNSFGFFTILGIENFGSCGGDVSGCGTSCGGGFGEGGFGGGGDVGGYGISYGGGFGEGGFGGGGDVGGYGTSCGDGFGEGGFGGGGCGGGGDGGGGCGGGGDGGGGCGGGGGGCGGCGGCGGGG